MGAMGSSAQTGGAGDIFGGQAWSEALERSSWALDLGGTVVYRLVFYSICVAPIYYYRDIYIYDRGVCGVLSICVLDV